MFSLNAITIQPEQGCLTQSPLRGPSSWPCWVRGSTCQTRCDFTPLKVTIPESHSKLSRDMGEVGKEEAVGSQEEWRELCRRPAAVERDPWEAPPLCQAAGVETCS